MLRPLGLGGLEKKIKIALSGTLKWQLKAKILDVPLLVLCEIQ